MAPTRMKLRVRRGSDNSAGTTPSAATAAASSAAVGGVRGPRGGRAAREEEEEETGGRRRRRKATSRKKSAARPSSSVANPPSSSSSAANAPSSAAANLRSLSGEDASPDSKCPICLDRFNNLSYLDCCLHRFCFNCIQEWSLNKAECPLCKQPFSSILHSVRAEDDFKEYTLRPPPPPPPPPGNNLTAAAERGARAAGGRGGGRGRSRRLTLRRRRGEGAAEEEEEEGPAAGEGRRAAATRRRRRLGEISGGADEWYLLGPPDVPGLPASPPTPPLPPAIDSIELHAYMDEQRRMLGEGGARGGAFLEEGGVIFGGLPVLGGVGVAATTSVGDARTWRRLVRRVATRRRLQREGGGARGRGGGAEAETLAFRRALYRTGVRVRGVAGSVGDSDRDHHRPVTAESFRRNSAHLERLRPWLRRELTALYGAHASLVDVVQRIICARLARHGLNDTPAVEDELRPFLLARTAHFLHELLSFARSPLDLERYDMQAVYDTPETEEGDTESSNNGSVISISEGEEAEEEAGGGGGSSSHHDDDVIQTGSSSFLSQSAWDDDETPGPSFTSSSVAELCSHSPGLLSVSPPAPPPRKEGGGANEEQAAEAGTARGDDGEEEACEIVGYVKPMAERTPELVQLSSDTEDEETLPPLPPPPALPVSPVPPSLPPPATSNADGERDRRTEGESDRRTDGERDRQTDVEKDRQTDGEGDRPSCRHADGKRDGQKDEEKEGGSHRDSERALGGSSESCARSHSSGTRDDSSTQRERTRQRVKEPSIIAELLSGSAREREKRRKRKRRDICDEEEEGGDEERRGRERAFPGVFCPSALSTPSPLSPWALPLSPENPSYHLSSSSSCRSSSSSSSPLSSLLPYLPLSPHRGNHDNKPSGKRKYKSRHLDDHADDPTWRPGGGTPSASRGGDKKKERGLEERRRDRRKRRERARPERADGSRRSREERSPSVEIIYEGTLPSSTPRSPSNKQRRKRSKRPKHNSAPVIITINSDSSHDDDDRYNNSSPFSGLQPIDYVSKLSKAVDDLGINISEPPVDIMDGASTKSDGEPDTQSKAVFDPVTVHDSEDDEEADIDVDDEPAPPHNSRRHEDDVGASVGRAVSLRPQEKESEQNDKMKEFNIRPKRRGRGGEGRNRDRDGGMRDGERETEEGRKDKTAVFTDTHLLETILSDLKVLANPKLNLSPTFDPTDIPPRSNHAHQSSQGVNADTLSSMEPRGRMSPVDSRPRSHGSPLGFHADSHVLPDIGSHRPCADSHPRSHSSPLDLHARSHSSATDSHSRSHGSSIDSHPRSHSSAIDSHPRSHKSRGESDARSHSSAIDSHPRSHSSPLDSHARSHSSAIDSHPRSHKSRGESDARSHSSAIDSHPRSHSSPLDSHARSHSSAIDSHPRSHKSRGESDARSHSSATDSHPRSHGSSIDSHPRSNSSAIDSHPRSLSSAIDSHTRSHKSCSELDARSHGSSVDFHQKSHSPRADSDPRTDRSPVVSHSSNSPNSVLRQTSPSVSAPPKCHPPAAASSGDDDTDFCQLLDLEPLPTNQKKADRKRKAVSSPPPLHRFNRNSLGEAKENGIIDDAALMLANRNTPPPLKHKDAKTFSPIPPLNMHSPLSESQSTSTDSVSVISPVDFPQYAAIFPIDSHCGSNSFVPKDSQPIPPISTLKRHFAYSFTSRGERTAGYYTAGHGSAVDSHPFSAERHSNSDASPTGSAHKHSRRIHSDSSIDLHSSREESLTPSGSSRERTASSWMSPVCSSQLVTKSPVDLTQLAKTSPVDIPQLDKHSSHAPPRPYARSSHPPTRDGHPSLLHKSAIAWRDHKHSYPGQPSSSPVEHKANRDSHWESQLSIDSHGHSWTHIDPSSKSSPNNTVHIWPPIDSRSKSQPNNQVCTDSRSKSPPNDSVRLDSRSESLANKPVRIDSCSKSSPNDPERSAKPPTESDSKPLFPTNCHWESGPSIDSVTECPDKDNESKSSHCPSHPETQCDTEGHLVDRTVSPAEDRERAEVCIEDTHTAM